MYGLGLLVEDMDYCDGKIMMKMLVGRSLQGCQGLLWLVKWAAAWIQPQPAERQENEVEHEATRRMGFVVTMYVCRTSGGVDVVVLVSC